MEISYSLHENHYTNCVALTGTCVKPKQCLSTFFNNIFIVHNKALKMFCRKVIEKGKRKCFAFCRCTSLDQALLYYAQNIKTCLSWRSRSSLHIFVMVRPGAFALPCMAAPCFQPVVTGTHEGLEHTSTPMPSSLHGEQQQQQPRQADVHTVFFIVPQTLECVAWETDQEDRPDSHGAGCSLASHWQLTVAVYNLRTGEDMPCHITWHKNPSE